MRTLAWAVAVAACVLGVWATPAGAISAVYSVDKTADAGGGACSAAANDCSLRDAITNANASAGADTIVFGLGAGTHTLTLASALPAISESVTIDGYSSTGASANTQASFTDAFSNDGQGSNAAIKIELNLSDQSGLVVGGGSTTIKGLAIYNAKDPAAGVDFPAIVLQGTGSHHLAGNFIGLKADGTAPADFAEVNPGAGVHIASGSADVIGGTAAADRNVISANGGGNFAGGIRVEGGANHVIAGNLIGTTPDGTDIPTILDSGGDPVDLNNGARGGIEVRGFNPGTFPITNLTIGGAAAGSGNLISGNTHDAASGAVDINGPWTSEEVHVIGNRVGTNVTGLAGLGNNAFVGIDARAPSEIRNNLVSGNPNGLMVLGQDAGSTVQGNRIGTDRTGQAAVPNTGRGVVVESDDSLIGGDTAAERNVISGNGGFGIGTVFSSGRMSRNDVQGNYIGTALDGTTALGNGGGGIELDGPVQNTIGGAAAGTENVIAGNGGPGILFSLPEGTINDENEIIGNKIGVDKNGAALGNTGPGVQIHNGFKNVIGRAAAGEGNVIANNGGDGVLISGRDEGTFGNESFHNDGNSIRGNSIFANGGLGIDLGEDNPDEADDGDGVTANDSGDGDSGNNELQNFPQVNAALPGGSTFVRGFLNSRPNTTYSIDLYRVASCDASGNGEGQEYLGSTTATTNGFGNALWNTTVATSVPLGQFVTATATDPAGNTSELSACRESGTQVADPAIAPPDEQQIITPPQEQQPQPHQPQQQPPAPDPCRDKKPPISTLKKAGVKNDKRGAKLILNGRSADHRDCPSGVARVDVSLARVAGRTGVNCRFIKKPNRLGLTRPQNCRRPVLFKATGTDKWTFTFPVRLPKGLYRVQARGTDKAKNKETPKKNRNIVFFEVK